VPVPDHSPVTFQLSLVNVNGQVLKSKNATLGY
jgi:hypothetical protein